MLTRSDSLSFTGRKADGRDEPADDLVGMEQRICALEKDLATLQRLVCQLLEKNERLRMQLQSYEQQLTVC